MIEPLLWILLGIFGTMLGMGILHQIQRWYRQRRYGLPIAYEELLIAYGHQMAGLLDQEAVGRMLAEDVPRSLDVRQAVVLLPQGHDLAAANDGELQLPIHHAAVRLVAAGGGGRRGCLCGGASSPQFVAQGHLGLAGMRERAAMIGGQLEMQTAVDYGTVVILEIPHQM